MSKKSRSTWESLYFDTHPGNGFFRGSNSRAGWACRVSITVGGQLSRALSFRNMVYANTSNSALSVFVAYRPQA
ncbi:hypothetical protein RSOLAG1IB_08443 [Rhizoctonia solani AG-1 IB]|uniref:Uncharacterized protein n=1 Tax=Thanatephorus cucumeris (strain AG1-IB / isolate 7/3/14) TaxID=1108050 RepID=A0A0B7FGV7_THACB|nr:hypothetical protein RSOLAG1IB_08443 [Rhizoctonia solani AG-1 IB]